MTPSLQDLDLHLRELACPLCGSCEFRALARHDRHLLGLQTVGCLQCGLVQTNPRPGDADLALFYSRHYRKFYQGVTDPSERYVATFNKDLRLRYTVDYLSQAFALDQHSRLLDYGCGEGSLFAALRKQGFEGELFGVEPNVSFAKFAAESGHAHVEQSLGAFSGIDVVTINHVLEHLADPVALLRQAVHLLKPGGAIYIDVPDAEEYEHVGDLHIAHITHFTQRTLSRVVQRAGYTVASCEKHRPPHHPRSIRLIARPDPHATEVPTTPVTEAVAWQRCAQIDSQAWKWVARKWLAGIPLLRHSFRLARRVVRTVLVRSNRRPSL